MSTIDNNGILFYEETDEITPLQSLLNTGQQSVSDALNDTPRTFPVTNEADRNSLLASRGSSASNPLFVYRQDIKRVEYHDGARWHVTADTTLGRARITAATGGMAGTPNWSDVTSVQATSLGGPVMVQVDVVLANGNSGANRTGSFRISVDGTPLTTPAGVDLYLPFVSGATPGYGASFEWESQPVAGQHTWLLQVNGSAGAAVVTSFATMRVTERP